MEMGRNSAMAPRFRVIEGGRTGAGTHSPHPRPRDWTVGFEAPEGVDADTIAAWRALLVRSAVPEPHFSDPDYLLTAARHQAAGRSLVFAFAWATGSGRPENPARCRAPDPAAGTLGQTAGRVLVAARAGQ